MHPPHIMKVMTKIFLALLVNTVLAQNEGLPAPLVANNVNDVGSPHHCIWYDKCGPDPGKKIDFISSNYEKMIFKIH
jgi:hypothetical protein